MEITQPIAIITAAGITACGVVIAAIASKIDWNTLIKKKEGNKTELFKTRGLVLYIVFCLVIFAVSTIRLYGLLSGDVNPPAFAVFSYMLGIFTSIPIITFCVGIIWHKRP